MEDLSEYAYLWDGSAPEWVLTNLRGHLLPLNTATGQKLGILDGGNAMNRIVVQMQISGCPILDFVDWKSKKGSLQEALQLIESIEKRVWHIRTRTTRALGERAKEIAAPIGEIRARLQGANEAAIPPISRQLWSIHSALLDLEESAT